MIRATWLSGEGKTKKTVKRSGVGEWGMNRHNTENF